VAEADRDTTPPIRATIRPLSVAYDLGAITRMMLPAEAGPVPPEMSHYLLGVAEDTRKLVRKTLIEASEHGHLEDVLAALEKLGVGISAAYEEQLARQRSASSEFDRELTTVECRKGCSFCCSIRISATVLEVARIANASSGRRFPDRRTAVFASADAFAGLDAAGHLSQRRDCPFLIEDACSIHEIRPLTCRALLSRSARACELQFRNTGQAGDHLPVPSLATPRLLAAGFINGEVAAMRDLGLASHLVELTSSLALLLRDPNVLVRWLRGEDVFIRP
jgi:hypothetical protein